MNIRHRMGIALLALSAASVIGQTVTTNLVTAVWYFREIDGKLYNTDKSLIWHHVGGTCLRVRPDGILVQTFKTNNVYETYTVRPHVSELQSIGAYSGAGNSAFKAKRLASSDVVADKVIFLSNYAVLRSNRNETPPAEGETSFAQAMQTGTISIDGSTLEKWDCGLPHVVPVVTTNAPSKP